VLRPQYVQLNSETASHFGANDGLREDSVFVIESLRER
jgi:hypothetical protein